MTSRTLEEIREEGGANVETVDLRQIESTDQANSAIKAAMFLSFWTAAQDKKSDNIQFVTRITPSGHVQHHMLDPDDVYGAAIIAGKPEEALKIAEDELALFEKDLAELDAEQLSDAQKARINKIKADLLFDQAYALSECNEPEKALAIYEEVIALDSENSAAWNNAGCELLELGQHEKALEYFKESARLDPNSVITRVNLAGAYSINGDMDACAEQLKAALACVPTNPCEQAALQQLKANTGWESAADVDAYFKQSEEVPEADKPDGPSQG